jgi:hypothetical protein
VVDGLVWPAIRCAISIVPPEFMYTVTLGYEINPRTSEAWIKIAMIHLMVRRLA